MNKNTSFPLVSVIMPVYNCAAFLKHAINSILRQTLDQFEFIIINDGSTDQSENIILSFQDKRILYIKNQKNIGIVESLNKALEIARGEYVARMDADDISFPNRLEKQYTYLKQNPSIVLCGTVAIAIDERGNELHTMTVPIQHDEIKVSQLFSNPFIHPSIMVKSSIIKKIKYFKDYEYAEDYHLFTIISSQFEVSNIDTPLLYYRFHSSNLTNTKKNSMAEKVKMTLKIQLEKIIELTPEKLHIQNSMYWGDFSSTWNILKIQSYLLDILRANKIKKIYSERILCEALHNAFYNFILHQSSEKSFFNFINSPIFSIKNVTLKQIRRLIKKDFKMLFK